MLKDNPERRKHKDSGIGGVTNGETLEKINYGTWSPSRRK